MSAREYPMDDGGRRTSPKSEGSASYIDVKTSTFKMSPLRLISPCVNQSGEGMRVRAAYAGWRRVQAVRAPMIPTGPMALVSTVMQVGATCLSDRSAHSTVESLRGSECSGRQRGMVREGGPACKRRDGCSEAGGRVGGGPTVGGVIDVASVGGSVGDAECRRKNEGARK